MVRYGVYLYFMKKNELKIQTEQIISMYVDKRMSAREIAQIVGCTDGGVLAVLRRNNIPRRRKDCNSRKYTFNESFFSTIDTEAKAYWLGFLYADGYHKEDKRLISLTLQAKDGYMLERLREDLGANHPIAILPPSGFKNAQEQRIIRFISKTMSANLVALGLRQAKSLTLQFPTSDQVPDHLIHHFIRGYFDGDGCVSLSRNDPRYTCIVLCVSKPFGEVIQNKLNDVGIALNFRKQQSKIHNLQACGRIRCLKFLDYIYQNATIFLERKYEKYMIAKSYISPKTPKTSKYFGVGREGNKWKASCRHNWTQHYLGVFSTEVEAAKAVDEFVKKNTLDKPINFS